MGIWVDTDLGFDDLWALMLLADADVEVDGVSLVFGCATLDAVSANARAAWQAFGWDWPVHAGRERAILGGLESATRILGPTGILTAGLAMPSVMEAEGGEEPPTAFDALATWLERGPDPQRILALGPLSNIAALLVARPHLAARIAEIVWMGGARGRGNHTAAAEFNAVADPEALAAVLAHAVPLAMIDLDACRRVTVGPEAIKPIRKAGGRHAALLADLLAGYVGIATSRGREAMAIYDPLAALAITRPEHFAFAPATIAVTLGDGAERGRTVVREDGPASGRVVADLDADALSDACLNALQTLAKR